MARQMEMLMSSVKGSMMKILPELVVDNILGAVLVIVIGGFMARFIMSFAKRGIAKLPLSVTIQGFLNACIRMVFYFVVAIAACGVMGIPISSLVALLGMAGLAVSLSLQNVLSNAVSGLVLLISKPFTVGDFVESGDASGTVNSITLLHTHLTTTSNKALFVPNSQLTSATISNHNAFPMRMVELTFNVPTAAKRVDVCRTVIEAASNVEGVMTSPEPEANASAMAPLGTNYELRVWCDTAKFWDVHYALFNAVKDSLEQAGMI